MDSNWYYGNSMYYSPVWYPITYQSYLLPVWYPDWTICRQNWNQVHRAPRWRWNKQPWHYWNGRRPMMDSHVDRTWSPLHSPSQTTRRSHVGSHSIIPIKSQSTGCQTSDETLRIDYELTNSAAVIPTVFDGESPGIDFYYPLDGRGASLGVGQQIIVNTHVIVRLPKGLIGVMMDKSSVVTRLHLKVEAGLIDTGYRGEIKIVLRNMGREETEILPGQAIAQMVLHRAHHVKLNKVSEIGADTHRGTRGFGQEQSVKRSNETERVLHKSVNRMSTSSGMFEQIEKRVNEEKLKCELS